MQYAKLSALLNVAAHPCRKNECMQHRRWHTDSGRAQPSGRLRVNPWFGWCAALWVTLHVPAVSVSLNASVVLTEAATKRLAQEQSVEAPQTAATSARKGAAEARRPPAYPEHEWQCSRGRVTSTRSGW